MDHDPTLEEQMPIASFVTYALVALAGPIETEFPGTEGAGCDTVQAGNPVISAANLRFFTIVRHLLLTRGDSVTPFGSQTETLTSGRLGGRPTLLNIQIFDTPRGKTVDSSWVDDQTLQPLRLQSTNAAREVTLDFTRNRVRGRTVPDSGASTQVEHRLPVQPFEWNVLGMAIGALPLRAGYCVELPVYSDRFSKVKWYTVEVLRDTTIPRKTRGPESVWEVIAKGEAPAPTARYWVSRHHRMVSRVLVSEPGISIMYARD
jgi:hypothetical protein